jgi:hypothetical protein
VCVCACGGGGGGKRGGRNTWRITTLSLLRRCKSASLLAAAALAPALEGDRDEDWALGDDVVDREDDVKLSAEKATEDLPFV